MRVRVHLFERSFPEEPDRRVLSRRDCRGHRLRHRAAHSTMARQSAVLLDNSDMHLGRERPPKTGRGTVNGGWQRGSLTPQMPPRCGLRPRSRDTGGKKRRPADKGPNSFIAKNIARANCPAISSSSVPPSLPISAPRRGDNCSETCCPPPFLDAEFVNGLPGERNQARRSLRW